MGDQALTNFQREVANIFFALPESDGYLLAGGAALVASELTVRPTLDLDLFTHAPVESIDAARDALIGRRNRPQMDADRHPRRTHLPPPHHPPSRG